MNYPDPLFMELLQQHKPYVVVTLERVQADRW
ncbi:hypothetical protein ACVKN2_003445 [Paenibacillus sp. PvR018]|nr:hypothetical protein [Paenibacillus sp. PvP091]MBP1171202.1 hypothetical protein [Paenibacillus sp. PvR098]MBP2442230.1 hypothetical protein [Paenibacillus sp. PvP052]